MQGTEIPSHVYARIAEHVSKVMGVDLDAETVGQIIRQETMMRKVGDMPTPEVYNAVMDEAKEYGLA